MDFVSEDEKRQATEFATHWLKARSLLAEAVTRVFAVSLHDLVTIAVALVRKDLLSVTVSAGSGPVCSGQKDRYLGGSRCQNMIPNRSSVVGMRRGDGCQRGTKSTKGSDPDVPRQRRQRQIAIFCRSEWNQNIERQKW